VLSVVIPLVNAYGDPEEYRLIEEVIGRVDHYKTLEVQPTATSSEIKKAFYQLSMKYHPDKIKKSEQTAETDEKFLKITRAYEVLHSKELREIYDRFRKDGVPWEKRYYGRWAHYYGTPNHDLSTVLIITIVSTTGLHWILKYLRYQRIVSYVKQRKVFKKRAEQLKKDNVVDDIDDVKVEFTGLKKPTWKDLLPVILTVWFFNLSYFIIVHVILRKPYDREAEILKKYNITKEEYEALKERHEKKQEERKHSAKGKKYRRMLRKYKEGNLRR